MGLPPDIVKLFWWSGNGKIPFCALLSHLSVRRVLLDLLAVALELVHDN